MSSTLVLPVLPIVNKASPKMAMFGALLGMMIGISIVKDPMLVAIVVAITAAVFYVERKVIYGVVFLAASLPFQQVFTVELLGYTIKPSHIMVMVILGALMKQGQKSEKAKSFVAPMDIPYGLFLLTGLASIGTAISTSRSFAILIWALISFVIYIIVSRVIASEDELRIVMPAFFFSTVAVALFGIYQFIASYIGLPTGLRDVYIGSSAYLTRVHSTFLEPLHFANFIVVALPLFLGWTISKHGGKSKIFQYIGLLTLAVALLMTISRGGYISIAISLAVFWLVGRHRPRRALSWKLPAIVAAITIALVLIVMLLAPAGIIKETIVGGSAIRAGSSMTRMMLIDDTMRMFADSPYIGVGIGNFGPYYNMKTFRGTTNVADYRQSNNVIFEVLAEMGVIGEIIFLLTGLAYAWMLWIAIRGARSDLTFWLAVGAAAASAGTAFQFMTYSPMYGEWVWFLVGLTGFLWRQAVTRGQDEETVC